jgi:hypothetical protein
VVIRTDPIPEEWAEPIARNVASAPPFSAETLEKLAVILGPAAAEVRRGKATNQRRS